MSFAWAHGLHALAIALLALLLGDAFEADAATIVGGGLGYLLTAAMALTSFDRTARWLGPRRWKLLHRAGFHWLWFIFALNWTGAAVAESLFYLPFAALTWAAAGLRLAALRARAQPRADRPAGLRAQVRGAGVRPTLSRSLPPWKGCHRDPALFALAAWIGAPCGRCAARGLARGGASRKNTSLRPRGRTGAAAALVSLVYCPLKLFYAASGITLGSGSYLWTWGDQDAAMAVVNTAVGGDYVVTPEVLMGSADLRFTGQPKAPVISAVSAAPPPSATDYSAIAEGARSARASRDRGVRRSRAARAATAAPPPRP